jgi:hypothetical protein
MRTMRVLGIRGQRDACVRQSLRAPGMPTGITANLSTKQPSVA